MTIKTGINNHSIVIVQDRYGGVYSGGAWLAFQEADAVYKGSCVLSSGPNGGDFEASNFWSRLPSWIAVGDTPDEAKAHLISSRTVNSADN